MHLSVANAALQTSLDDALPRSGEGNFQALGSSRRYTWRRESPTVTTAGGRVAVRLPVTLTVPVPLTTLQFPLTLVVEGEPVIRPDFVVAFQGVTARVTSSDARVGLAQSVAGVNDVVAREIETRVQESTFDLRPLLRQAYDRLTKPVPLDVADAKGCAFFRVLSLEASPTLVAGGLEKDVALVVAAEVSFPCSADEAAATLPPLQNVSTLAPGPFSVTVPIVARYDELTKAMGALFTDGRYYFSKDHPRVYLTEPEVYASQDQLVVKMRIRGTASAGVLPGELDGDLYLSGHPTVRDNEISVPDLEPTIETKNFLLQLTAMTDNDRMRDDARRALRVDLSARLAPIKDQLRWFVELDRPAGCVTFAVDRIEVTGIFPHGSFLRAYVTLTARASASFPCPT
jgi:hypothetical protein